VIFIFERKTKMYKIAFDVMGADHGVAPAVSASLKFLKDHKDLHLVLVGDAEKIQQELNGKKYNHDQLSIHATTEEITMHDGILDVRRKKDSSMVVALDLVKEKAVDAMMTGGNSAAFIAGSHLMLKEFDGILRPGFMPTIPTIVNNKTTLLLDAGANSDNSPEDLLNFAKLATIYLKAVKGIEKPLVGLLNIGTEDHKGTEIEKETHRLLQNEKSINFYGNIESRDMTTGLVDVIVTDGWSGNIALKSIEGMAKNLLTEIKASITKGLRKFAALGLKKAFREVGTKFDYKNNAGAILIGVNGIVFKSHGSSDEKCYLATLRMTFDAVKADVVNKMKEMIK
jgi:glycerol-3-phosphate acyltransferase PlsX